MQIPRLREDLLDRKPEAYAGVQRNLFYAFHREEVEVKAPPIVVAPPPPPPPVAPSVPEPPPPPTPQQLATQELARFTFLGFLKKEADKTIFLAAEGEIFLVHKGDRFGRKREFFVTDVTTARLVIRQEEVGEIVVPLVDQEALKPASFSGAASSSASPGTAAPPPSLPARSWGRSSDVPVPVPVPTPDETQPNEAENEN